jgi:hypothetical protein
MILTVQEFKDKYLLDKADDLFTTSTRQSGSNVKAVDDNKIEQFLLQSEEQVKIDTNRTTLPETDVFKYAVATYCMSKVVSEGVVKIQADGDRYVNTYYANYINIVKRLRRYKQRIVCVSDADIAEIS